LTTLVLSVDTRGVVVLVSHSQIAFSVFAVLR